MTGWRSVLVCAFGLVVGLMSVGCGDGTNWPKRYPVSGKVLVDGKPAERAVVTFHPLAPHSDGKSYAPSTFTDDDGAFKLTTIDAGDGAPPGEYAVTIVANYVSKGGQDVQVPDLLKGKYADPKSTPLKVTVKAESNALSPFDLNPNKP